jgi:hypothetical protein
MIAKIASRLAFAGMRSFAPQASTSIGRSGSAQAEGTDAFRSSKITGANSGVGAPNAKACSRAAFRQAKTWLGATPAGALSPKQPRPPQAPPQRSPPAHPLAIGAGDQLWR